MSIRLLQILNITIGFACRHPSDKLYHPRGIHYFYKVTCSTIVNLRHLASRLRTNWSLFTLLVCGSCTVHD